MSSVLGKINVRKFCEKLLTKQREMWYNKNSARGNRQRAAKKLKARASNCSRLDFGFLD